MSVGLSSAWDNSAANARILMKFDVSVFFVPPPLPKYVPKIRVLLKYDKNNEHFTWQPMYEGWNVNSGKYLFTIDTK